jgi:TonB family protein
MLGAAHAADITNPIWVQAPDRSDWAKAYPTAAAAAGVAGEVQLRCTATVAGSLDGCQVVHETPSAYGFGAAALSLTSQMQLKPTDAAGESVAGRNLIVPVKFAPDLLKPGSSVTHPDWLRRPTNDELVRYLPAEAHGAAGKAMIECLVSNRGLLERCKVRMESPINHGFGASALAMTDLFVMRPMTVDGDPVGGSAVVIPINFESGPSATSATFRVMGAAPWAATPSASEMSAAFPRGAVGKVSAAHVVLRCAFGHVGDLRDCETVGEEPPGHGFASAARTLSRDFRVVTDPHMPLTDLYVDIPFDFRDPSQPAPPLQIYDPVWLQQVNPDAVIQLFPPEAVKAGYTQGKASVICDVAHDGGLTGCSVVSETPAGLGFGDAALKVASIMKMNPWTRGGDPVDGARIVLPIKLVLPSAPAPVPSTPPPKP